MSIPERADSSPFLKQKLLCYAEKATKAWQSYMDMASKLFTFTFTSPITTKTIAQSKPPTKQPSHNQTAKKQHYKHVHQSADAPYNV